MRSVFPFLALISALALLSPPAIACQGEKGGSVLPRTGAEVRGAVEAFLGVELSRRLAPAERWEFTVSAAPEERAAGRIPNVSIRGINVRLPDGLVIALIELRLTDVELDVTNGVLRRSGKATFLAHVRPDDVARHVEKMSKGKLRGVRIDCGPDRIKTRGSIRFGFLGIPLSRASHPQIRGNAVYARTYSMKVLGINVGHHMRKMEAKINPVVDLDELGVPVHLERLETENGEMVLEVSLDLAGPLRPNPAAAKGRQKRGRKRGRGSA